MSERNAAIIREFRSNQGRVGGVFEDVPILLLHHKGAKTGTERINPLAYQAVDGGYAIFASKGGADTNPAWYHNILANPESQVEVGTDVVAVRAREAVGEEHDRIWAQQKADIPTFAEYEKRTSRDRIPIVVLEAYQDDPRF